MQVLCKNRNVDLEFSSVSQCIVSPLLHHLLKFTVVDMETMHHDLSWEVQI